MKRNSKQQQKYESTHEQGTTAETEPSVVVEQELLPIGVRTLLKSAPSLRPGSLIEAFVAGHPEAVSAILAWKFHEPVRAVNREQWDAMLSRNQTVFHG